MDSLQTMILLIFAATILVGIAQKIHIPYPVALVCGGITIGFLPGLHPILIEPNNLLVMVLPPILYYAAFGISFREFKQNWRDIFSLALGLVVVSTIIIGVLFKSLFPEFSWALAFAFGAIVAPPDAVTVTTILKRFAIGPRLLAVLEGESLINDASAIVLYKLAVIAILSETFSLAEGSMLFAKIVLGGILIGIVTGFILQHFSKYFLEPIVGVVFSFTIPYVTYILADSFEVSGVLAVVVNGLIGSQILPTHHSSLRRILGFAAWDIIIILLNCFVFILIGLQLRSLTSAMALNQMILYSGYALMITSAMIAVRMFWVYAKSNISYLAAYFNPKFANQHPLNLLDIAVIGWSGMRGIVSLAIALALPLSLPNGLPLEGRDEVIFITFVVILMTLLIPGLTLPYLLARLNIHSHSEHHILHKARKQLAILAEETIHRLHELKSINHKEFDFLKSYFNLQHWLLEIYSSEHRELQKLESIRLEIIQAQRKKLLELWKKRELDDRHLRYLELELDAEETRIARGELK